MRPGMDRPFGRVARSAIARSAFVARSAFSALVVLLALALPDAAFAERGVWLTGGGGVVWIPNELPTEPHRPLYGGILGLRFTPSWAIELRGGYATSSDPDSGGETFHLIHGDGALAWSPLGGPIRPFLTAGLGMVRLKGTDLEETKLGLSGGLGFFIPVGERAGIRLEGREVAYKVFVPSEGGERYRHGPEAFAGFALGFGGPPKDEDRDGVPDRRDTCPASPFGARVDAAGCPIDSDSDGVPDGIDRCDATPSGAAVDERGCPADSDQDGVFDGIDACANTPPRARVTSNGCPIDSDKDTVPDGLDQCEATPVGCVVNPNGCPADDDQDGVCDGLDRCADTPASARVDASGCPIEVNTKETELLETGMIRLQDVNFDTGRATIKAESYKVLDDVGDILGRWPDLRIEIAGHTDSRGTDARNLALSQARAQSVRDYLLERFPELRPGQFAAKGYGEAQPVATNTTALGRARNRRVEFRVLNKEVLKREKEKRGLAPKE